MLSVQTQYSNKPASSIYRLNAPQANSGATHMRGVGLIEVLVALLVLSVGIMGVAGLQLNAKRANYEAIQRSTASALAQDILERMRGNAVDDSALSGTALGAYVTNGLGGGTIQDEPSPACGTSGTTCTPTQLAAHDLWEWERAIDGVAEIRNGQQTGGLVSPTACISRNADGTVTVAIAWLGTRDLSNPTANNCGSGLGRYGTNDARRQLLTVTAFITTNL